MAETNCCSNAFGILSVAFGIISIVLPFPMFFNFLPSIILGILGIIFAIIQIKSNKNNWAIAGLILSLLGTIIGITLAVLTTQLAKEFITQMELLNQEVQSNLTNMRAV